MKRIYSIAAMFLFLVCCAFAPPRERKGGPEAATEDKELKQKALNILEAKCNFCHATKNPSKVFTLENMNDHAGNIYRQVFVWRRMPKNNAVTLSADEEQVLRRWLSVHTNVKK
ncbi:hypothetical protein [Taibaiella koreensis]|uniref:hypothetical protein n=1 Tax=Taibaiella koreensis TaxID=1268548 RepID=UPI000E5A00BC|nr:hypothetical protein [Taibaiella koreensis]